MNTESNQKLAEKIRAAFPRLAFTRVRRAGGEDHVALILDEKWIFRFPRTKTYERTLHTELELLSSLKKHRLPFKIPSYRWIERHKKFGGYAMIHGRKMTRTAVVRLDTAHTRTVAKQLAHFLTVLHTLPAQGGSGSARTVRSYAERYFDTRRAVIRTSISSALLARLDFFFRHTYAQKITPVPRKTWTHRDVRDDHILFDQKKQRIAGIIDFGDADIGDPAFDFTSLWDYGAAFIDEIYRHYHGPKDGAFLHRSELHYLRWAADELYYAILNGQTREAKRYRSVLEKNLPR